MNPLVSPMPIPAPKKEGLPGFSPLLLTTLIMEPLRWFFQNYAGEDLKWDPDYKKTKIEICSVNDFNKEVIETIPRILIDRGNFRVDKTGLSDNMASAPGVYENKGKVQRRNLVFIRGSSTIIVEARNEGTCELIVDMVMHFLVWSRPFICDSQGFNDFALPLSASSCSVDTENTEKFKASIDIPYSMEEDWAVNLDAIKIQGFFEHLTVVPKIT